MKITNPYPIIEHESVVLSVKPDGTLRVSTTGTPQSFNIPRAETEVLARALGAGLQVYDPQADYFHPFIRVGSLISATPEATVGRIEYYMKMIDTMVPLVGATWRDDVLDHLQRKIRMLNRLQEQAEAHYNTLANTRRLARKLLEAHDDRGCTDDIEDLLTEARELLDDE